MWRSVSEPAMDDAFAEMENEAFQSRATLADLRSQVVDGLAGPLDPSERAAADQAIACYDEALGLCDLVLSEVRWMREGSRKIERAQVRLEEIGEQLGRLEEAFGGG